ncbi:hypothetical protein COO60DRAFT_1493699 [Scenedesmus sp. NREL 46B-D3]|nr:hypothetical protein COO60DRAFT_1493699 [Scenedesmus sp. NREL 46B-D3]
MSLCMLLAQCMPALLLTGMRCVLRCLCHTCFFTLCDCTAKTLLFVTGDVNNTVILHAVICSRVSCLLPLVCGTECLAHNKPFNQ